jgi:3-deoxy-manno-octulosonate cytidylyltransferase (CMP-KDO synthetase)
MTIHLMIPARYASTRLPGKVLLPIGGKPMLAHVVDRAVESGIGEVSILCDDDRVEAVARELCDRVLRTSPDCLSGTERIAEAVRVYDLPDTDIVINIQADEPFIEADKISAVADLLLADNSLPMATLAHRIEDPTDLTNPNVVKVVLDNQDHALYFSRSLIPWAEKPEPSLYLRHIGLYAYRVGFLKQLQALPPSPLQLQEKLEQLTVLYHGFPIKVGVCAKPRFIDINTQEDYEAVVKECSRGVG